MISISLQKPSASIRVCFFVAGTAILISSATDGQAQDEPSKAAASKAAVGVSYADEIDQKFRKNIQPDQNALAKLYEAIGPRPEGTFQGEEYFRRLGIPVPPDSGKYFSDFAKGLSGEALQEANDEYGLACDWLWKEEQYPDLAKWVRENAEPMAVVHEATLRPEWYYPMFDRKNEDGKPAALIGMLLPHVQKTRSLARYLAIRANLHLANDEPEQAWKDLQTCHRLGRLTSRGPTLIDYLVGAAINSVAIQGELRLLNHAKLTERQIDQFLLDLSQLPPMPDVLLNVDVTERRMFLDSVTLMGQGYLNFAELTGDDDPLEGGTFDRLLKAMIDWDEVRKKGNEAYDELVAALEVEGAEERRQALAKIEENRVATRTKFTGGALLKDVLSSGSASNVATDRMADVLIALMTPAIQNVDAAQVRCLQMNQSLVLAFQLQKYKVVNGGYPEDLPSLEKALSITIPPDLCNGQPLTYSKTKDGYFFYSVGTNGIDQGGKSWNDPPLDTSGTKADDLIIRMPLTVSP